MKIAIIVNPLIPVPPEKYGGIERVVFMLIQELISQGQQVTLFAHPSSKPNCRLRPYTEAAHYSVWDMLSINLLTSKIALQGFDLVHTFGRMSNIALLMLTRLPKIVSYQLPPTLSQVKKAVQIAPSNSLHFTACSNYIQQQIAPYCCAVTIYNGVNIADYDFNATIAPDAPLVFLGRIQAEKGTAIAIETARRTGRKLIIAGNIPDEALHQAYFKEQVEPYVDGGQIVYIGAVNDRQKNELLQNALALLMPVTWDEPFGIVMAEALACGTPVIGFNRGAVPEIIRQGINGFVCNTTDEMVQAITRAAQIDRNACRKIAEENFSARVLGQQYLQLYQTITGKN